MGTELRVAAQSSDRALTLRVSGLLGGAEGDDLSLRDALSASPQSELVVFDLRELQLLTPSGLRTLLGVARALRDRGVRCRLVVDSVSAVATVLEVAGLPPTLPVFYVIEQALGDEGASHTLVPADAASVSGEDAFVSQFVSLTRTLVETTTVGAVLGRIVDATQSMVRGADLVSMTLRVAGGAFFTPVETDAV